MGKRRNKEIPMKAIPLARLEPGTVLLVKGPKGYWEPGMQVTEIQVLKDDGHTPYENMKLQDIGKRSKAIRICGLFWNLDDHGSNTRWDQQRNLWCGRKRAAVLGDQIFYEGYLCMTGNKTKIGDNLVWVMSSDNQETAS